MSSVFAARVRALPWVSKQGVRAVIARLADEPPIHDAALEFAQAHSTPGDPGSVLEVLDRFGREKRFLMNVGDVKGVVLERTVQEFGPAAQILELGSFVGYSSILMARQLANDGRIVSVDSSEKAFNTAREMATLAGVDSLVQFVNQTSGDFLRSWESTFDLVLVSRWIGDQSRRHVHFGAGG